MSNYDAYIEESLRPLAAHLRARYPGVRVVAARFDWTADGIAQQCIRFGAPLDRLKACGLVVGGMAPNLDDVRRGARYTPCGDGYSLCDGLDALSIDGEWDLSIFTGIVPRERERFSVRDAERELRRIARASVKSTSAPGKA